MFKNITYTIKVFIALVLVSTGLTAHAVRMGPLSVDSALGEPLKAYIVIYDAAELDARVVTVSMASPSSYDVQGLIYNDLISRINLRFESTANGSIIHLSTEDAVNEVVIDLQVDLVGPEGKVSRTYVAFIDPPLLVGERLSLPPLEEPPRIDVPTFLEVEREVIKTEIATAKDPDSPVVNEVDSLPLDAEDLPEFAENRQDAAVEIDVVNSVPAPKSVRQIVVRPGDTLSKIAKKEQLSGFSLEQMLVSIFRKNREAFVGDNMNRLRAGNVIRIPVENELRTISTSEATNEIRIQMADWRAYRTNLAARASETQGIIDDADRKESGRVGYSADRVNIQDGAQSSHVVKISKGDGSERGALEGLQERLLATEKALEEQKRRADDLEKIIANLKLLTQTRGEGGSALNIADPSEALTIQDIPGAKKVETLWQAKLIETILAQPLYLFIPVGLLLIIGLWASKRLNRMDNENDSYEARRQFDAATNQLNPAEIADENRRDDSEVSGVPRNQDPIEDADIFLAYGRYPQAEKILREALRLEPGRLDVLLKLAEVYSRQKDLVSFDEIAQIVSEITNKAGAYWERVIALGYLINPSDERYADGKFASERQPMNKPFDLSSIDLNLGNPPSSKS